MQPCKPSYSLHSVKLWQIILQTNGPYSRKLCYATTAEVIGYRKSHHKDWFDDQDGSASHLLDEMYDTHLSTVMDK